MHLLARITSLALVPCVALVALACSGGDSGSAGAGGLGGSGGAGGSGGGVAGAGTGAGGGMGGAGGAGGTGGAGGAGGGASAGDFGFLTLNLHCLRLDGTVFADNEARFGAIADLVAAEDVAVVTLQEACERPGVSAIEMLRAAIEARTGVSWSSTWSFAHVAWEGTPDQADEGVGLLVRGELVDPTSLEHRVQGPLRRVAMTAKLPEALGGFRVHSVHLEVGSATARAAQAREVAVAALVDTDPDFGALVAGDFNDIEGSETHSALPAMGFLDASDPLDAGRIDHVFVHRATPIRAKDARLVFLGSEAVSDHPGVLVRFAKATPDAVTVTRVEGAVDVGVGHFLSIRGSAAPLGWDAGFVLRQTGAGTHRFVTTEMEGAFAFKLLRDDIDWQLGADVPGSAGTDHVVSPSF